jgi:hypothetical protein
MDTDWQSITWRQFGAAIDMLDNAIIACPDRVWGNRVGWHEFWYLAYHTIFFLDYYLSDPTRPFTPPSPFTLSELDPSGVLPDRVYTKDELRSYLAHRRQKCRETIAALTEDALNRPCGFERRDMTVAELLLYTMRHVQHHAAQLNLLLRQTTDSAPSWVGRAKDGL